MVEAAKPKRPRRRTPRLLKSILSSGPFRALVCFVAALYIRLVHATGSWQTIGGETPRRLWAEGKPFILAFWHGRLLMMPYSWRTEQKMNMLISQHRDGEIIARTIAHFGLGSVRGSAGNEAKGGDKRAKGGVQALRSMARAAQGGQSLGITPDGPRGPRMRASEGVAALARLTGLPVLPAAYATRHRLVLGTWDRFLLALPFSRGVIIWGDPIHVPKKASGADLEAARAEIEAALNRVTAAADAAVGRPAIEPAAPDLPALEAHATSAAQ